MAKPSEKHPDMTRQLDDIGRKQFGRSRTESIERDICLFCGEPAIEFRDALSEKEYTISALCQKCQDDIFGK